MIHRAIHAAFALILFGIAGSAVARANESDLIAIDVLLEPDAAMVAKAREANSRLRHDYSQGFAFDATHVPHITLLQRFVRVGDLPAFEKAMAALFKGGRAVGMNLTATGYRGGSVADARVAVIAIRNTPDLARLQQEVAAAAAPFAQSGGTATAFFERPVSSTIAASAAYVNDFTDKYSGPNFAPHVTVGVGLADVVDRMVAEPFAAFGFKIAGAAIYQLGDIGTARKKLWAP